MVSELLPGMTTVAVRVEPTFGDPVTITVLIDGVTLTASVTDADDESVTEPGDVVALGDALELGDTVGDADEVGDSDDVGEADALGDGVDEEDGEGSEEEEGDGSEVGELDELGSDDDEGEGVERASAEAAGAPRMLMPMARAMDSRMPTSRCTCARPKPARRSTSTRL